MGCDRISELPELLLTQILLNLTTKESVSTSVLSKRWKNLWSNVPGLELDANDIPRHGQVFNKFIVKFLEINRESRMQKFKIHSGPDDRIVDWIATAVDRGIQHLVVETDLDPYMPQNIYKSNTLGSLKLVTVGIQTPKFSVSLPCLKIMHLENIWYDGNPWMLERLISGSPILEDLTLIGPTIYVPGAFVACLRVRSQTLKILRLKFANITSGTCFSVEIDAPILDYLSFKDNQSEKIVVKNLSSLFKIVIDTEFHAKYGNASDPMEITKRTTIYEFLCGISNVRHMNISLRTIEVLSLYCKTIPQFDNVYHLQAASSSYIIHLLPTFLKSFPNLKDLILDFTVLTELWQTELTYVPQCLLSSLECVEIRELTMEEETEKKLVRYFLEKAVVLKRLILAFKDYSIAEQDSYIFKEILRFKKRSCKCKIIIH